MRVRLIFVQLCSSDCIPTFPASTNTHPVTWATHSARAVRPARLLDAASATSHFVFVTRTWLAREAAARVTPASARREMYAPLKIHAPDHGSAGYGGAVHVGDWDAGLDDLRSRNRRCWPVVLSSWTKAIMGLIVIAWMVRSSSLPRIVVLARACALSPLCLPDARLALARSLAHLALCSSPPPPWRASGGWAWQAWTARVSRPRRRGVGGTASPPPPAARLWRAGVPGATRRPPCS